MSPGAGPAVLTVVLPLAGAVTAWLRPSAGAAAGLSSSLGILATVLALGITVAGSGPVTFVPGAWPAALGIALSVDGTAVVFLVAGATTGMAATIHARGYFGAVHPFWALWLLLWAALNAVFLTADAFNAYVALELAGLTAATLVTLGGGRAALAAGLRYLMLSLVGATAYLAGVALFYGTTGSLRLADYADAPSGAVTAAGTALVLTGLLLKAAIFPLHGWLPPAHARAPGPVSAVLSALVVKAAIYLAWRWLDALPPALIPGTSVLAAAGGGAVIWGSLQALRVGRLKAIVAYSTVAQLGYLAIGLALLRHSPLAATGVAWMALTHALAKGAAFLAAANVVRAAGHDRWPAAAGALRAQPLSLVTFALAAVSLAGLPPSGGFVAKWYLMTAAMEAGHWPLALVLAGGGLLAAAYLYRILQPALDPRPGGMAGVPPGRLMQYSALGLALAVTALGVAVPWLPGLMTGGRAVTAALPILAVTIPLAAMLLIFPLSEDHRRLRTRVNLGAALLKLALVVGMLVLVADGAQLEAALPWLPGRELVLRVDALALLFLSLSSLLWLFTTIYAIGYLEGSPSRSRFFGFFSLCVAATAGIALAGNLLTFFFFYELLSLATYPLVIHRGTAESRRAGATYLRYTLGGGALLLVGIVWFETLAGPADFAEGPGPAVGALATAAAFGTFWLMIAGVGVKAALVPLHGWLPQAMVAPAPVSALLHAVAVVKAGAFGVVRVVHDVYGVGNAAALGLLPGLAIVASVTILWGSMAALRQGELKKRLAYSTVSQVAYIALGVAMAGPLALVGGIVHIIHQGLMKITLFFGAGNLAETLGIHHIHEMDGVGRRMPLTMAAFTVGALGMIGTPPLAGFVTKWYLGLGALEAGMGWVIAVLAASSALNAVYFLPLLYRAWFREPVSAQWHDAGRAGPLETRWTLLLPPVFTALGALGVGVLAGSDVSPLAWADLVATRIYRQ